MALTDSLRAEVLRAVKATMLSEAQYAAVDVAGRRVHMFWGNQAKERAAEAFRAELIPLSAPEESNHVPDMPVYYFVV